MLTDSYALEDLTPCQTQKLQPLAGDASLPLPLPLAGTVTVTIRGYRHRYRSLLPFEVTGNTYSSLLPFAVTATATARYLLYYAVEQLSPPHVLDGHIVNLGVVLEELVDVDHIRVLQGPQDANLQNKNENTYKNTDTNVLSHHKQKPKHTQRRIGNVTFYSPPAYGL